MCDTKINVSSRSFLAHMAHECDSDGDITNGSRLSLKYLKNFLQPACMCGENRKYMQNWKLLDPICRCRMSLCRYVSVGNQLIELFSLFLVDEASLLFLFRKSTEFIFILSELAVRNAPEEAFGWCFKHLANSIHIFLNFFSAVANLQFSHSFNSHSNGALLPWWRGKYVKNCALAREEKRSEILIISLNN